MHSRQLRSGLQNKDSSILNSSKVPAWIQEEYEKNRLWDLLKKDGMISPRVFLSAYGRDAMQLLTHNTRSNTSTFPFKQLSTDHWLESNP